MSTTEFQKLVNGMGQMDEGRGRQQSVALPPHQRSHSNVQQPSLHLGSKSQVVDSKLGQRRYSDSIQPNKSSQLPLGLHATDDITVIKKGLAKSRWASPSDNLVEGPIHQSEDTTSQCPARERPVDNEIADSKPDPQSPSGQGDSTTHGDLNGVVTDPRLQWPTETGFPNKVDSTINNQDWNRTRQPRKKPSEDIPAPPSSISSVVVPRFVTDYIRTWIEGAHVVSANFLYENVDRHEDCDVDTFKGTLNEPIEYPKTLISKPRTSYVSLVSDRY